MFAVEDAYNMFVDEEEARREHWLRSRPVCRICGEPIQSEYMYDIDGWYCEDCKDDYLRDVRKNVDDYVEGGEG